jgi:hypothetical protein
MEHRIGRETNQSPLDFIFILALLCVFAFGALIAVILGSNTYQNIKEATDSNYELRTPLSYISTKIRQSDSVDSIRIIRKEGIDALVLETVDNGEVCETWIYEYQGSLCEVYLEKGTPFQLEDGLAIIPGNGLEFDLKDGLLMISARDHLGEVRSVSLSFRTEQGGDS